MDAQAPALPPGDTPQEPQFFFLTKTKKIERLKREFSGMENVSIIQALDEKNEIVSELGYLAQQALASETFDLDRTPVYVFDIMENALDEMRALGNVLFERTKNNENTEVVS